MAKNANQKLRLLYLQRILTERSDQEHPLSLGQIADALGELDIVVERKTLYDDFEALRSFGMDIVALRGKTTLYYAASRAFELPELKLLVDAVQSSRFITHKKSEALIKKLSHLCSAHQARKLQRQVYVWNRIKTGNEGIYYNVDTIYTAVQENKQISFQYFAYTVQKQRQLRKEGQRYMVSPMALSWDDENYYLMAYDGVADMMKHYRVDKMSSILVEEKTREGTALFGDMDMAQYTRRFFSMFNGRQEQVKLRFADHLVGVVLDRFGTELMLSPQADNCFTVNLQVEVSPQFFGWLAGLGAEAVIVSPNSVMEEYRAHICAILNASQKSEE